MGATVWSKFYWNDWRGDPALRACSLAARGLWIEMLCIAANHDPIGYVCLNGRPVTVADLARMVAVPEKQAADLLAELERNGVFNLDRRGRMYSRRMIKDAKRAAEGRKHGKMGGNPTLCKQGKNALSLNRPDNLPLNSGGCPQSPEAQSQIPTHGSYPQQSSVPDEVHGWVVGAVVDRCLQIMGIGDTRFPDLPRAIAELLAEGADPDRHVYATMRGLARRGIEHVVSANYLAAAVRAAMKKGQH
jgi:hypothetical protein